MEVHEYVLRHDQTADKEEEGKNRRPMPLEARVDQRKAQTHNRGREGTIYRHRLASLASPAAPFAALFKHAGSFPRRTIYIGGVETEETAIKSVNYCVSSRRKSEKCQVVTRPPLNTNAHLHLLRFFAAYPTRPMSCRNARSVVISNDFCCCTACMTIEYAR